MMTREQTRRYREQNRDKVRQWQRDWRARQGFNNVDIYNEQRKQAHDLRAQSVVELLLRGWENYEIAKELKVSERTVKSHLAQLFVKYQVKGGVKRVKLAVILYKEQRKKEALNAIPQLDRHSYGDSSSLLSAAHGSSAVGGI